MQGNLRLYLKLYLCCRIVGDRQNKMPEISVFTENQPILGKENGLIRFYGSRRRQAYTTPWASMASATFRKPAMLAPAT